MFVPRLPMRAFLTVSLGFAALAFSVLLTNSA